MKQDLTYLQRCKECDITVKIAKTDHNHTACCPNCNKVLHQGHSWKLIKCTIIAISILILLPFALTFPLMRIDLLGMPVYASVWGGIWKMAISGYAITAFMVLICAVIMPCLFASLVVTLAIQRLLKQRPKYTLLLLTKIQPWVMLDVYFVALAVAAFKVHEYADLHFDIYLSAFVITTLLTTLLFIKINPQQLWSDFYPEYHTLPPDHSCSPTLCAECEYTFDENIIDLKGRLRCPRCESKLTISDSIKLQRVWATLVAGTIMLIPANILPISITNSAGSISADSLISGVLLFIEMGSYLVAMIVFVASILVPFSKIIIITYLLLAIHYRFKHNIHFQLKLLHYVHFVGRWSMLDLFVLALMMSLVERGQIISFSVGSAAVFFGAAVFLTMISSSNLDAKMLWKIHKKHKEQNKRVDVE
ncbi:paraquat-inducible protein A [Phocoenobacter atlanticus]|uniref:paraquat-inducible protein A n=1 Tax=Phocoenobacter atlanticus TaxID=3416742 RepID=UPI002757380C|nr:paraquat-inducible protein A [Pasteurella atlantica]MDP8101498.1 paraquat-inducible protein A [Pasteurella atlantica]